MYTGGSDNLHAKHNKVIAHINYEPLSGKIPRHTEFCDNTWPYARCVLQWDSGLGNVDIR